MWIAAASLAGRSVGAQLRILALLQRARAFGRAPKQQQTSHCRRRTVHACQTTTNSISPGHIGNVTWYAELSELPLQVSLVGHSAGAQLCTMALLQRAKALSRRSQRGITQTNAEEEVQMPARLIGASFQAGRGMQICTLMTEITCCTMLFSSKASAEYLSNSKRGGAEEEVQLPARM